MPIPVSLNIAIRNLVRASMVLPTPPLPLPLEELPLDTDEASLKRLRDARAIPTARQDQDAAFRDQERAARAQLRSPAAAHIVSFTSFTSVVGSLFSASVAGPFSFPYAIEEILLTLSNTNAAGTTGTVLYTVLVSNNDSILLDQLQQDTNIILFDPLPTSGIRKTAALVAGQSNNLALSHPNFDVPNTPTFLKALVTIPAGVSTPSFHITINEAVALTIQGARFEPPIGRTTININTAGAVPRTAARAVPRAARLSITQGGRLVSDRIVAWEALAPAIRADWFNRQVGGAALPNIEWIP